MISEAGNWTLCWQADEERANGANVAAAIETANIPLAPGRVSLPCSRWRAIAGTVGAAPTDRRP